MGTSTHTYRQDERNEQILINITSNAVKFTPKGGSVDVRVAINEQGEPTISVSDTGIGIEQDKIEAIFEPFVQAEESRTRCYEGAGLGLAIARQLARLHKGELVMTSEPGEGTTVTLTLPKRRLLVSRTASSSAA